MFSLLYIDYTFKKLKKIARNLLSWIVACKNFIASPVIFYID